MLVKIAAPLQVALFGPNSVNVIDPVGLKPPDSDAESTSVPGTEPSVIVGPASVVTVGLAVTLLVSFGAPHSLVVATTFFEGSPL